MPVKKKDQTNKQKILRGLFLGNVGNTLTFCFQAKAINNIEAVVEGRKASVLDNNNFLRCKKFLGGKFFT